MKKFIGAAMLAGAAAAGAGAAHAEGFSANVTLTTDYLFRGLSLSGEDPAIQGGFQYDASQFYVGVWGTSLGAGGDSMEMDVYAGFTPQVGPVALDIGVIGYFYPGASDDFAEFDFYELALAGSVEPTPQLTLGAGVNYSPDMYGETGAATYAEVNGRYAFTDQFQISAAYGQQRIADINGPLPGTAGDSYATWNIGGVYALHGFEFDLRYHDSNIGALDAIITEGFIPFAWTGSRVVFSISRSL